jgi:PAS domain S-box-containing protein
VRGSAGPPPSPTGSGRRDALVAATVVVALSALGAATDAFDRLRPVLEASGAGADVFGVAVLLVVALAVLALREAGAARVEVAERIEVEERLRTEDRRWRQLLEDLPVVAYEAVFGQGDEVIDHWMARGIESLLGVPVDEWRTEDDMWAQMLHPDDRDAVLAAWDTLVVGGDAFDMHYRMVRTDGATVWVHDRAVRNRRDGHDVIQGAFADVTAWKHAEAALQLAQERFRTLVEQLPVAVYTDAVDAESSAVYISPQYEALTGYSPTQRVRERDLWVRMLHPDDRDRVLAMSAATNETHEPFDTEYRIVAADGRVVWLHDHAVLVDDADGVPRWHGVLQDVTVQHLAAEAIARRDAILEATGFAAERFLRAGSWERDLPDVLRRLALAGEATRAAVFRNLQLADGDLGVSLVAAWPPDVVTLDTIQALDGFAWEPDGFGRWVRELGAGRAIHGDVASFPVSERTLLEAQPMPIRSLAAVPIFVEGEWWGYISFDHVDEPRQWLEADVEALTLTARTIGAAIERERVAERFDETQARYRMLIEQIPAVTYIEDAVTGDEIYSSPQTQALLGYPAAEWGTCERWLDAVHPDDRDRVLATDRAAETGDRPFDSEYRLRTASGDYVWVREHAAPIPEADGRTRYWQGVRFDITAEKHAQERLRAAEERYRLLVEQTPAVTYVDEYDPASALWPTRYISPQAEAVFGHTAEEWLAEPDRWLAMIHPDDREATAAADAHHYATGEPLDVELRVYRRDGELRWIRDQAVIVRDEQGTPRFSQGLMTDVTDRKDAEMALRDAERRYRTLIESIPAVTYIDRLEEPWSTLYVSPQVTAIFGYEPDAWVRPGAWIERVHPDDREAARAAVTAHGERGEPFDLEYRLQHRDGRWLWVRDQAFVVRDDDGTPLFSQGVLFDITEAKTVEERLREAEERYRAIVEHVPAAIYLDRFGPDMQTVYISPQVSDILGVSPTRWIERRDLWLELMDPDERPEIERSYRRALDAGEPWRGEYRVRTPDGRTVWLHDETTFLGGPDGEPAFVQGVLFDITERKLAEQALRESEQREREAAERLRALDEMKNTFLAAVSHELRSPLTTILGLALTLERAPEIAGTERDDLLTRLSANARKLDRLLKDLLDIDRLNRGIIEPQYRATDVGALARRTVEHLDAVGGRAIILRTEPIVVAVDAPKVERIVENLVTNAVRHTDPDRTIWVGVRAHDDGVEIVVEDDGPGVPPELRTAIFEPFRQGPTASAHAPGTGIGLSLVARFAELHGGRAWVGARDGGGASFHVELPAGVSATEPLADDVAPAAEAS